MARENTYTAYTGRSVKTTLQETPELIHLSSNPHHKHTILVHATHTHTHSVTDRQTRTHTQCHRHTDRQTHTPSYSSSAQYTSRHWLSMHTHTVSHTDTHTHTFVLLLSTVHLLPALALNAHTHSVTDRHTHTHTFVLLLDTVHLLPALALNIRDDCSELLSYIQRQNVPGKLHQRGGIYRTETVSHTDRQTHTYTNYPSLNLTEWHMQDSPIITNFILQAIKIWGLERLGTRLPLVYSMLKHH